MATRGSYRDQLKHKLLGLEDEGYGDFEFTDIELDTYLELAVVRLFPAIYQRVSEETVPVTNYGTNRFGGVETDFAERVFLVEDATELTPIYGWEVRPGRITKLDTYD